jgi:hypothetical protein
MTKEQQDMVASVNRTEHRRGSSGFDRAACELVRESCLRLSAGLVVPQSERLPSSLGPCPPEVVCARPLPLADVRAVAPSPRGLR